MSRREPQPDDGSATVLAVGIIAAVLSVTVGALVVLGVLRAAHVARSAADLAALAAAGQFQERAAAASACAEARDVAAAQDARVTGCEVDPTGVVTVTAVVTISPRPFGTGPETAEGRARAGPAPP